MSTKDDLEALLMPGMAGKVEIFDAVEKAIKGLIDPHKDDRVARALTCSAIAHIAAEIVAKNTCCAYHAMEVWEEIAMAVIAGVMPGEDIEWEKVKHDDDDGFYVPPPIERPKKPH